MRERGSDDCCCEVFAVEGISDLHRDECDVDGDSEATICWVSGGMYGRCMQNRSTAMSDCGET